MDEVPWLQHRGERRGCGGEDEREREGGKDRGVVESVFCVLPATGMRDSLEWELPSSDVIRHRPELGLGSVDLRC